MRIGIWPGSSENSFVQIYSGALEEAGACVVPVEDPSQIEAGLIDILHIHWPESVFWQGGGGVKGIQNVIRSISAMWSLKRSGVRIVWMVHNLRPHDMTWKKALVWIFYRRALLSVVDAYLTLSPGTMPVVRTDFREARSDIFSSVWHPTYPTGTVEIDRDTVRMRLGIPLDARVYGLFGIIRPYKGIDVFAENFGRHSKPNEYLLIGGDGDDRDYLARISAIVERTPRVTFLARRLSHDEFSHLHACVDFIVLPFVNSLHSGSMMHALSETKPVITPSLPFAESLRAEVGDRWVQTYRGQIDMRFLSDCLMPDTPPRLEKMLPRAVAADAMDFYKKLLSNQA